MRLFHTPEFFKEFSKSIQGLRVCDLGCGGRKYPEAIGVDIFDGPGVDVVHDLDAFPYPFSDASFDVVILNHVVEHLSSLPKVMAEVSRILAPGGKCWIVTPHFTDADSWADPTHKYHFSIRSMNGFQDAFKISLAYVSLKGRWKDFGYEYWINKEGLSGQTGNRVKRWESKHCFSRRGGEMYFILERR